IEALRSSNEIDYSSLPHTISPSELAALEKTHMAWISLFAGLGHQRCLQFTSDALKEVAPHWKRVGVHTVAGKVHEFGSNNLIGKSLTEFVQRNRKAQQLSAAGVRAITSYKDAKSVLTAASHFLETHDDKTAV